MEQAAKAPLAEPPPSRGLSRGTIPRRHILITGASGGLGSALAREFSNPRTHLTLWGRDSKRLEALACQCRSKGADCDFFIQDNRAFADCRSHLRALYTALPVDMAILNAGVSSGLVPDGKSEPAEDACRTMEVNAAATVNMAATLLADMALRGKGQLVFISSIASLYPLPSSPAYSAAKAALSFYARALRLGGAPACIRISIIYPGYVDSPMSRRLLGPQPLRWSAEKAAAHIRARLEAGRDIIIFPRLLALGTRLLHLLPPPLAAFFLRRFAFTVTPDGESPLTAPTARGNGTKHG